MRGRLKTGHGEWPETGVALPCRSVLWQGRIRFCGEVLSKFGQLLVPMFSHIPMVLQPGLPTAILAHVPVGRSSYAASAFRLSLLVLNSSQVYGH